MRGRMPRSDRAKSELDWSDVEWFIYDDPVQTDTRVLHCYRVAPRKLSPGECRRFEKQIATVTRCSLRTVRMLLKRGVPPQFIQGAVDGLADAQAKRTPIESNVYRELLERLKPKGATAEPEPAKEAA